MRLPLTALLLTAGLAAPALAQLPSNKPPVTTPPARVAGPVHQPPADLRCPGDRVVWVNTRSHVYHVQGDPYFGATKTGKFMCLKAAEAQHAHGVGAGPAHG